MRESQINSLRQGLIPLVVDVSSADVIATLLELKAEVEAKTGKTLRLTLSRATEAHLLAKEMHVKFILPFMGNILTNISVPRLASE
jgi:hypothetical protein